MSLGSRIKQGAKATGKFLGKHAPHLSIGQPQSGVAKVLSAPGRKVSELMDAGLGATKHLVKKTDATFYNGYTGLKPSGIANTIGWGAAGVYVGVSAIKTQNEPTAGTVEYGQSNIMTGDGMGTGSKAPSLGANGSLVFGLNSMRKG